MLIADLENKFREHVVELNKSKEKNARFKASAYERVADLLEATFQPTELFSAEKIDTLGLTDYMKTVVKDVAYGKSFPQKKKKTLPTKSVTKKEKRKVKMDDEKNNDSLLNSLVSFMGIGQEKAKQLIEDGLTNVNQLHMKKWLKKLPEETKLFLQIKPVQVIQHENIKAIEPKIKKLESIKDVKIELVGSYRRKKKTSRDIDVMVISKNPDILIALIKKLKKLFKDKAYPYSQGKDKLSIIVNFKNDIHYKMDMFRVDPSEYVPMLLYSTGSKQFNIKMRAQAKKQGYLLNQRGLFKKNTKSDTQKTQTKTQINTKSNNDIELTPVKDLNTEQDYFSILGMEYLEPHERV